MCLFIFLCKTSKYIKYIAPVAHYSISNHLQWHCPMLTYQSWKTAFPTLLWLSPCAKSYLLGIGEDWRMAAITVLSRLASGATWRSLLYTLCFSLKLLVARQQLSSKAPWQRASWSPTFYSHLKGTENMSYWSRF